MSGHDGEPMPDRDPEALNQEGAPRAGGPDPALAERDTQALTQDEMIVYEAIATVRRPMNVGDVAATTGLDQETVRACLETLTKREMIVGGREGVEIGKNDWDVWGAQLSSSRKT